MNGEYEPQTSIFSVNFVRSPLESSVAFCTEFNLLTLFFIASYIIMDLSIFR